MVSRKAPVWGLYCFCCSLFSTFWLLLKTFLITATHMASSFVSHLSPSYTSYMRALTLFKTVMQILVPLATFAKQDQEAWCDCCFSFYLACQVEVYCVMLWIGDCYSCLHFIAIGLLGFEMTHRYRYLLQFCSFSCSHVTLWLILQHWVSTDFRIHFKSLVIK